MTICFFLFLKNFFFHKFAIFKQNYKLYQLMKMSLYFVLLMCVFSLAACRNDKVKPENQSVTTIDVSTIDQNNTTDDAITDENSKFEINEYFESFIAKNGSNTTMVNIEKPKMGSELLRKGDKLKLEINGYWINEQDSKIKSITFELYPNAFKKGIDSRPIVEQKLKLKQENRFLIFGYLNHITLEEGLYYYFLIHDKTVIYTGKFLVK